MVLSVFILKNKVNSVISKESSQAILLVIPLLWVYLFTIQLL